MRRGRVARRLGTRAVAALVLGLCGCLQLLPQPMNPMAGPGGGSEFQKEFLKHFHKAVFSISGDHLFVRSDDVKPWRRVHITLDTEHGYYRQTTGDMEPGQVRELALQTFADESGNVFGPGIRLKSVWIQARDPNDEPVNELAFPAETFGYRSPVPPRE